MSANFIPLFSTELDLSGRKITVWESSYQMNEERTRKIAEMYGRLKADDGGPTSLAVLTYINTYAALVSCSTGDVPTEDEFKNTMRRSDIETWIVSAKSLNDDWFEWMNDIERILTDAEKKVVLKKKGKTPKK
jgi:hypothetical protein